MTRKVLGRGLNALLQDAEVSTTPAAHGIEEIALDLIDPNPFQPRRAFADDSLKELADSLRATGLVQPILLRKLDARYQLIAGERRWRAAHLAGMATVPAVVRPVSDEQALEQALTENLLREDLNAIEVANAYQSLQEKFKLSHEMIADRLGVSRVAVTNTLRLLRLSPEIQDLITSGKLSAGHARAVLAVDTPEAQLQAANHIVKNNLSVRQAEQWVAGRGTKPSPAVRADKPAPWMDPNIKAAIRELERALSTKVKIVGGPEGGKIEISYYSSDDLTRIYDLILTAE